MGCDIHAYMEIKINGKWIYTGQLILDRNYAMFSVIAGVRQVDSNPVEPIAEDRGLPDDASDIVKKRHESWGADCHSTTYFSSEELPEIEILYNKYAYDLGYEKQYCRLQEELLQVEELEDLPYVEEVRVVVWFDN